MKKNILRTVICLSSVLFAAVTAQAQTATKLERSKMEALWTSTTDNAAGGSIDQQEKLSVADFEYLKTQGDFKRVQLGDDNNTYKFHTEGGGIYTKVNNIYLWGDFTYTRDDIAGAKWNATLIDPLRGMPYYVADSTVSKWHNQEYKLAFKAATPLMYGRLIAGVAVSYDVAQGAKQVDPRPLTKKSDLSIIPSVIFHVNDNIDLGADFKYGSYREDGQASNSNSLTDQHGWEMVSPGFYSEGLIASFGSVRNLRSYNANLLGGGLQAGWKSDTFNAVLSGNWYYRVEDATCSYTKPQMAGTTKENVWNITLAGEYKVADASSIFFNVKHNTRDMDGIEYFQTYDNTYEVQSWVTDAKFVRSNFKVNTETVKVDYMKKDDENGYKWLAGAELDYVADSYIYYVPETTRDIDNLVFNVYSTGNFNVGKHGVLNARAEFAYGKNTKGEFDYNGTRADDYCFQDFTMKDFDYMCTDYTKLGASVTYTLKGVLKNSSLYLGCAFSRYFPSGDEFAKRQYLSAKVGLAF